MMNTVLAILLVLPVIAVVALAILYPADRCLQEKQTASQPVFEATKQLVTILSIDKRKVKLKGAGFPKLVWEQIPFYLRWVRVPIVKVKVGAKIITLMADETTSRQLPLRREYKVVMSGIYVVEVRGVHGGAAPAIPKKRSLLDRILHKK